MHTELESFVGSSASVTSSVQVQGEARDILRIPSLLQVQRESLKLLNLQENEACGVWSVESGQGLRAVADLAECAMQGLKACSSGIMSKSVPSIQRISCPQAWV